MTSNNSNLHFQTWQTLFSGVDASILRQYYTAWEQLNNRSQAVGNILSQTHLLSEAKQVHLHVEKKLDYEIPYHIVVLGESGAGKSSLINALLGQDRLVTGAGGAITGVPVYVYPIPLGAEEHTVVTYRTEDEFMRLARNIAGRYQIELPDTLSECEHVVGAMAMSAPNEPDERRHQLLSDLRDILSTWRRIETQDQLGDIERLHPEHDRHRLQQLMEERSELNTPDSPTRIIAGIAKIEYFLHVRVAESDHEVSLQYRVVLIDTPGIGARTMRHEEILYQEIEQADAVILVVNARRPEDRTVSMAHLLNQTLLSNFSPDQKDYFSQKVFLIVNQIDAIRNTADKRRLDNSVSELCSIISPRFWATHVAQLTDLRYFETIAELSIYAQASLAGTPLEEQSEGRYRGYLESQLPDAERQQENIHLVALKKSQVGALRSKLSEFLGQRRLQLMIRESEVLLKRVIDLVEEESTKFFTQYSLNIDEFLASDPAGDRHYRHICLQQLGTDRQELHESYSKMWWAMQDWRRSEAYGSSLKAQLNRICRNIDSDIRAWLDDELSTTRIITVLDATMGQEFVQMYDLKFLHEAEQYLRRLLESQGRQLATYYLSQFEAFIKDYRIHEGIEEKSYNQSYIVARLRPAVQIKTVEGEIRREFVDICRWVTIYEAMRKPLLAVRDRAGSITPAIVEEVSKHVLQIALATFDITSQSQTQTAVNLANRIFTQLVRKLQPSVTQEEEDTSEQTVTPSVPPQEREMNRQLKRLREEIDDALNRHDIIRIKELVGKELSTRSKEALGRSLPYLDMFFFYELEKHQHLYEKMVNVMYEEHCQQILDRNENIRLIIIRQNQAVLTEASELLDVIRQLRAVASTQFQ